MAIAGGLAVTEGAASAAAIEVIAAAPGVPKRAVRIVSGGRASSS